MHPVTTFDNNKTFLPLSASGLLFQNCYWYFNENADWKSQLRFQVQIKYKLENNESKFGMINEQKALTHFPLSFAGYCS